jgi:hypothetical protein
MTDDGRRALTPARIRAGLTMQALYMRYIALGGAATEPQLVAHFGNGTRVSSGEHDLAVHALNERFLERGATERLPYAVA